MTSTMPHRVVPLEEWVRAVAAVVPDGIVDAVDLSASPRAAAARSRLSQGMARVAARLFTASTVRRAVVLVWAGEERASARVRAMAQAAAEAMHRRCEMTRGCPVGLVLILIDADTPLAPLTRRLAESPMRDGVVALPWGDVCAHGVREAAAAFRI